MLFPSHAVFFPQPHYINNSKEFPLLIYFMNQQEDDGKKMQQKVSYGVPNPPHTHPIPPFVPTASTLRAQQFRSSASWSTHHHTTSTLPF